MDIVNAYYNRMQQATNQQEKEAVAAELHQLAATFNSSQRLDYEAAMLDVRAELLNKLPAIDEAVQRAQALMATLESRQTVRV